jgi:uncharacterized membrane protein YdjX (TVP38/TMEM64 family)
MRWAVLWVLLLALILVPFFLFESQFNAFATEATRSDATRWLAAASIIGLLALDVLLPVPSSIVSTAAGVLLGFWMSVAVICIGMTIACLVGYVIGAKASNAARRFLGADSLARAHALAESYGDWAIVLCRPVPVLAEASVIFAGLVRAPFRKFFWLTVWSNLGIAAGYSAFGAFSMRIDSFLIAFLGALIIPGMAIAISRLTFARGRT